MAKQLINYFTSQAWLMFLHASGKYEVKDADDSGPLKPQPNSLALDALSTPLQGGNVHTVHGKYNTDNILSELLVDTGSDGNKIMKLNFFNMTTDKLSQLVPELKLYKAVENELIPFYFPIAAIPSAQAPAFDTVSTLGAAAVQNFSVSFTGTDPFTAPRYLEADMTVFVDNIANIFVTPPEPGYATLADLFTISLPSDAAAIEDTTGGAAVAPSDLSRPIEIVATLAYAVPRSTNDVTFTFGEIDDIINSNLTLRMNVFHHQINLNQDGSATIDIKYTARIDTLTRDKIYNVADNPIEILMRADVRQIFSNQSKQKSTDPSAIKKAQIEKALEMSKILELADQMGFIKSVITTEPQLTEFTTFGATINQTLYDSFLSPLGNLEDEETKNEAAKILGGLIKTKGRAEPGPLTPSNSSGANATSGFDNFKARVKKLDTSNRTVHYILFGDLLQCFIVKSRQSIRNALTIAAGAQSGYLARAASTQKGMTRLRNERGFTQEELSYLQEFVKKEEKERKEIVKKLQQSLLKLDTFRILLSDIEYKVRTPSDSNNKSMKKRINIGNIPISLTLWQSFAWKEIQNSYRNSYTLPEFLEHCMSKPHGLLPNALSDFNNSGKAPYIIDSAPDFTSSTFTGPELRNIMKKRGNLDVANVPSPLSSFQASSVLDESDYYVIHQAQSRELSTPGTGVEDNDLKRGIYHFHIGKNRGLIKDISFSRFEVPYAQEQLMTNQVGKYDELKMPYQANITMFGNSLFFPGSQIFIDPSTIGFGSSLDVTSPAFRLGLGGYYTVLSVSTNISNGEMETSLECSFGSHASFNSQADNIDTNDSPIMAMSVNEAFLAVGSKDSEPDLNNPSLRFGPNVDETESVIYIGLMNLTTKSGAKVVDEGTAQRIAANHHAGVTLKIPGVAEESLDPDTGRHTLKLANGMIIRIDPASGSRPVSLVYEPQEIVSRYDSRRPPPPTGMEEAILRRISERQLNEKMREQGHSNRESEQEVNEALREIYDPANNSRSGEE